jgi:hypothetical protein
MISENKYNRSLFNVELDITYKCNLSCKNCNRSCDVLKSEEDMSVEQIKKFINDSINHKKNWKKIRILGGEPTLHKHFLDIFSLILSYKNNYNIELKIEVSSNNIDEYSKNVLKSDLIKNNSQINISKKTDIEISKFVNIYIAPKDVEYFNDDNFESGCVISQNCGIGFNLYGYYPCPVAANMDRFLGFNKGRKTFPEDNDDMVDLYKTFCRYCGYYKFYRPQKDDEPKPVLEKNKFSKSWVNIFENFYKNKPILTKIYTIK